MTFHVGKQIHVLGIGHASAEALNHIHEDRPDVLILDLMMPRVSGLDVLDELKKTHSSHRPFIIVLTAKVNEEERALAAGANEFLRKPFSPLQLMEIVEKAIEHHRAA